ncbi:MAG: HIT family protein [Bacteroidales bacterium]|jgi:histidine triad (HIT) family protein|nr:HIT family protein [Bacteroidales bacterium]
MASIFSKIIAKEIPCYKIGETENCFAFLDVSPLSKGHTLVIPKKEVDYIFDLDDNILSELTLFAKKVAKAIEKVIPCKKVGVAVIGLQVPHAHIHLVPLQNEGDLNFSKEKVTLSKEEFQDIAEKIASNL